MGGMLGPGVTPDEIAADLVGVADVLDPLDSLASAAKLFAVNPAVARVVRIAANDLGTEDSIITLGGIAATVVSDVLDPDTEVDRGADADEFIANLLAWADAQKELIPAVSVVAGEDTDFFITFAPGAAGMSVPTTTDDPVMDITDSVEGLNAVAGTITPDQLPSSLILSYIIPCSDESTPLISSEPIVTFRPGQDISIIGVIGTLTDAPTDQALNVNVFVDGVSILDENISIPIGEKVNTNGSLLVSPTDVAWNSEVTVSVPDGDSTAAGLKVIILYRVQ